MVPSQSFLHGLSLQLQHTQTNITNFILLQSTTERLEFFHLVYPPITNFHCSVSSKLCFLHLWFRQLYLQQLCGGIDKTWEPKTGSLFWCVSWVVRPGEGRQIRDGPQDGLFLKLINNFENYLCTQGSAGIFFLKFGQNPRDFPHKFRSVAILHQSYPSSKDPSPQQDKVEESFPDMTFFHRLALENRWLVLSKSFPPKK